MIKQIIDKTDGYIEEYNGNKYFTLVYTDKNKNILKKYPELWNKIKDRIRSITNNSAVYDEKYMKIKSSSDDNIPLNKILKLHDLKIVGRSLFQEDKKYYPQVFYMSVCMNYKCLNMTGCRFQKALILIRQVHQKNVIFAITDIF